MAMMAKTPWQKIPRVSRLAPWVSRGQLVPEGVLALRKPVSDAEYVKLEDSIGGSDKNVVVVGNGAVFMLLVISSCSVLLTEGVGFVLVVVALMSPLLLGALGVVMGIFVDSGGVLLRRIFGGSFEGPTIIWPPSDRMELADPELSE